MENRCSGAKRIVGCHKEWFKICLLVGGENLRQPILCPDKGRHVRAYSQEFKGDLSGCVGARSLSRILCSFEICLAGIVGKYSGNGSVQQTRIVFAEM